jgi:hypothetical protein
LILKIREVWRRITILDTDAKGGSVTTYVALDTTGESSNSALDIYIDKENANKRIEEFTAGDFTEEQWQRLKKVVDDARLSIDELEKKQACKKFEQEIKRFLVDGLGWGTTRVGKYEQLFPSLKKGDGVETKQQNKIVVETIPGIGKFDYRIVVRDGAVPSTMEIIFGAPKGIGKILSSLPSVDNDNIKKMRKELEKDFEQEHKVKLSANVAMIPESVRKKLPDLAGLNHKEAYSYPLEQVTVKIGGVEGNRSADKWSALDKLSLSAEQYGQLTNLMKGATELLEQKFMQWQQSNKEDKKEDVKIVNNM